MRYLTLTLAPSYEISHIDFSPIRASTAGSFDMTKSPGQQLYHCLILNSLLKIVNFVDLL